ncbi:MAG: hypothetical protein AAB510_03270 [Patescibacteria group bacterium]
MQNNIPASLQIKIEQAKAKLPEDTLNAIAQVDWRAALLKLRETKGYDFEQLGDLELETELLLCGLLNPHEYTKTIAEKMHISEASAQELTHELNESIFKKIKEEMIQITERKNSFTKKAEPKPEQSIEIEQEIKKVDNDILESTGIKINPRIEPDVEEGIKIKKATNEEREDTLKMVENPEPTPINNNLNTVSGGIHPLIKEKIATSVQNPTTKTEYTIGTTETKKESKVSGQNKEEVRVSYPPKGDPYRLSPDE